MITNKCACDACSSRHMRRRADGRKKITRETSDRGRRDTRHSRRRRDVLKSKSDRLETSENKKIDNTAAVGDVPTRLKMPHFEISNDHNLSNTKGTGFTNDENLKPVKEDVWNFETVEKNRQKPSKQSTQFDPSSELERIDLEPEVDVPENIAHYFKTIEDNAKNIKSKVRDDIWNGFENSKYVVNTAINKINEFVKDEKNVKNFVNLLNENNKDLDIQFIWTPEEDDGFKTYIPTTGDQIDKFQDILKKQKYGTDPNFHPNHTFKDDHRSEMWDAIGLDLKFEFAVEMRNDMEDRAKLRNLDDFYKKRKNAGGFERGFAKYAKEMSNVLIKRMERAMKNSSDSNIKKHTGVGTNAGKRNDDSQGSERVGGIFSENFFIRNFSKNLFKLMIFAKLVITLYLMFFGDGGVTISDTVGYFTSFLASPKSTVADIPLVQNCTSYESDVMCNVDVSDIHKYKIKVPAPGSNAEGENFIVASSDLMLLGALDTRKEVVDAVNNGLTEKLDNTATSLNPFVENSNATTLAFGENPFDLKAWGYRMNRDAMEMFKSVQTFHKHVSDNLYNLFDDDSKIAFDENKNLLATIAEKYPNLKDQDIMSIFTNLKVIITEKYSFDAKSILDEGNRGTNPALHAISRQLDSREVRKSDTHSTFADYANSGITKLDDSNVPYMSMISFLSAYVNPSEVISRLEREPTSRLRTVYPKGSIKSCDGLGESGFWAVVDKLSWWFFNSGCAHEKKFSKSTNMLESECGTNEVYSPDTQIYADCEHIKLTVDLKHSSGELDLNLHKCDREPDDVLEYTRHIKLNELKNVNQKDAAKINKKHAEDLYNSKSYWERLKSTRFVSISTRVIIDLLLYYTHDSISAFYQIGSLIAQTVHELATSDRVELTNTLNDRRVHHQNYMKPETINIGKGYPTKILYMNRMYVAIKDHEWGRLEWFLHDVNSWYEMFSWEHFTSIFTNFDFSKVFRWNLVGDILSGTVSLGVKSYFNVLCNVFSAIISMTVTILGALGPIAIRAVPIAIGGLLVSSVYTNPMELIGGKIIDMTVGLTNNIFVGGFRSIARSKSLAVIKSTIMRNLAPLVSTSAFSFALGHRSKFVAFIAPIINHFVIPQIVIATLGCQLDVVTQNPIDMSEYGCQLKRNFDMNNNSLLFMILTFIRIGTTWKTLWDRCNIYTPSLGPDPNVQSSQFISQIDSAYSALNQHTLNAMDIASINRASTVKAEQADKAKKFGNNNVP